MARQRMSPAEKFMAYIVRNCKTAQIEMLRTKMQEGWKPFKVAGTTVHPVIYCSMPNGIKSNIVPGADHMRIEFNGACVRYDPRRK